MDGSEVVARLRIRPDWASIPIVVVSGRDAVGSTEAMPGYVAVARGEGLTPGETMGWLHQLLATGATAQSASPELTAEPPR